MELKRDLELLYEVGTMRHIARSWSQFGNPDFSNLAEHTLRVIWIALVIGKHENADLGKICQLALFHDVSETRAGDINYLTRMYVQRDEEKAVKDLAYGTVIESEIIDYWLDVEEKNSLEAKIVKDADNLDCDLELQEQMTLGVTMKETLSEIRKAVYNKLHTETAKKLYLEIQNSDPNEWHAKGRNRFTSGDWRKNDDKNL